MAETFMMEGGEGLKAAVEGPMGETVMAGGGEGLKAAERADLELKGLGISDLISSALGREGHSANANAMALSSALRSIRAPEKHVDSTESEMPNDHTQVITKNRTNTHEDSRGWSKPPERPGCRPCREDHIPNYNY